jgi:predicted transcriptional regulator
VKSVIPAVRALIATELVENRGLRQDEVAEILGISQSAVSKYARQLRGHVIHVGDIREVRTLIDKMISSLMNNAHQRAEFLESFCEACRTIRKTGLMCEFCHRSNSRTNVEECSFCLNP